MTTISLCVITRDSAPHLPRCIESAQELVDEVIVLDSGELNGAGEWAAKNGVHLVPYVWTGDVSQARTTIVRSATSDWILMMNSDEQLAQGGTDVIRKAIEAGGMDCGYLSMINSNGASTESTASTDGASESEIARCPRLLRRTIDLRWDPEDAESVTGWIAMRARRVRSVDAAIIQADAAQKSVIADVKIDAPAQPTQAVAQPTTPDATTPESVDIDAIMLEAWSDYHDNDLDGARAAVARAWAALTQKDKCVVQVMTLRAHIQILDNDYRAALETIGVALNWGIHHPNMDMLQGVVAENAAMDASDGSVRRETLQRAADGFRACTEYEGEISATDSLPGVTTWAAQTRLGSVYLALGDIEGARIAFTQALEVDPEHAEATIGLLEVRLESGQAEAIMDSLLPFMEANIADAWMLAAASCERMGRVEDALLFVRRAHELVEDGLLIASQRSLRMQDQLAMAGAYVGQPIPGPGRWGALGAILGRHSLPKDALLLPVDDSMVVRLVTHFIAAGWIDMIEALLEPRANQVVPGVSEAVRQTLEAHGAEIVDDHEPEPIFIGGAWDSGITTLQAMLDAHHHIEAGQELKLVPILCSLRNEWWAEMAPDLEAAGIGEKELDAAVKAFVVALLGGCQADGMRRVESTAHTLLHMAHMGQIFPRARFIHVVRDGRRVAASLLRREWVDPSTGEKVWCCQNARSAAQYWAHVVGTIREQAEAVSGRYLEIRYEDLIAAPEETLRHVLAFMGESWDPSVLDDMVVLDQVEGIEASTIKSVVSEAGEVLEAWGYSGDTAPIAK